jgi:hypothetical protein
MYSNTVSAYEFLENRKIKRATEKINALRMKRQVGLEGNGMMFHVCTRSLHVETGTIEMQLNA